VRPFLAPSGAVDSGGAHGPLAGKLDVNGGRMDGFIRVTDHALIRDCHRRRHSSACAHLRRPNVMSYHDEAQIPNYWAYARNFVLQDHMRPNWGSPACAPLAVPARRNAATHKASTCTSNLDTENGGPAAPVLLSPRAALRRPTSLTDAHRRVGVVKKGAPPDFAARDKSRA
jgi:hypothetical protein